MRELWYTLCDRISRITMKHVTHHFADFDKLTAYGDKIMSALSSFIAALKEHQASMDSSLNDLGKVISNLNAEVAKLQASAGEVTAEDQASLDAIQAHAKLLADGLDALEALKAPSAPEAPVEAAPEAPVEAPVL